MVVYLENITQKNNSRMALEFFRAIPNLSYNFLISEDSSRISNKPFNKIQLITTQTQVVGLWISCELELSPL